MTTILALCLTLAGTQDAEEWEALSPGYQRLGEGRYEEAAAEFTAVLERESLGPRVRIAALLGRGDARLLAKSLDQAVDDYTAAIRLDPNNAAAYANRAAAYRLLGDENAARADMQRYRELIESEYGADALDFEYYEYGRERDDRFLPTLFGDVAPLPPVLGLWGLTAALYLLIGRRQRIEGGGSRVRWCWVSAAAAAMATAPLTVWAIWVELFGPIWFGLLAALPATVFAVVFVAMALGPPVRLIGTRRELPLVEDAEFVARVEELAARMRMPGPRVRLVRSASDVMATMAFAGGLTAPSLTVTDGVLHRLSAAESDAIVAHEMAHIANGSIWMLAALAPAACTAAVLASRFTWGWPIVGLALFVGLRRLVSRPVELACDRRAARAIGFRVMASALEKIHAAHPIRDTGWLAPLIYATATHPSREARLAALREAAPEDDRPDVAVSAARLRRHRRLSRAALVVWLAALAAVPIAPRGTPWSAAALAVLLLVSVTPMVLVVLGLRRHMRWAKRRVDTHLLRGQLLRVVLLGAAVGVLLASERIGSWLGWDSNRLALFALAFALLVLAAVSWPARSRRLAREVALALQIHEFDRALELGDSSPKRVARNHLLRHNLALAAELAGDRRRAIAELEQLRLDRPRFALAALVLGTVYLDDGQAQRALELAEETMPRLRGDPAPRLLAGRALRALGRLDEAQAAVDRSLAIDPEAGDAHAVVAGIALDRGDYAAARQAIETAHQLAPGDVYVLVVQAQIALAAGDEDAQAAVERAVAAVEANPFAILRREATRLRQHLARPSHTARPLSQADNVLPRVLETEAMETVAEAVDYDAMDHSEVNRIFVDDLLAAGLGEGEVLDLATGTAQIPIELCRRQGGVRVLATDLARHMLELARRNVEAAGLADRIRLARANCTRLPLADGRFAAVICNGSLHHIPEPLDALAEAWRVLAPGGLVLVRDLLRPPDDEAVGHLVRTYAGQANDHQRRMFEDSIRASLTVEEVQDRVAELGVRRETVRATSDRHWTWSARKT